MTTFAQGSPTEQGQYGVYAFANPGVFSPALGTVNLQVFDPDIVAPESAGTLTNTGNGAPAGTNSTFVLGADPEFYANQTGFDFFEKFHVIPRSFDFGNLLSDQSIPMEVFNARRRLPAAEWTSVANNAGAGASFGGLPSLPTNVDPLYGLTFTFDVAAAGDPIVDGTLDFGFLSDTVTIVVPVELNRIVLWGLEPELEFVERLAFLTDVHPSKDGSEVRHSLRGFPRQSWGYRYLIDEGLEAAQFDNFLFDFQARLFGLPVWFEDAFVSSGITAGDTTISVDDTAFRDFRVGGFAVILTSQATFDVLKIAAGGITATTLTFESPTLNSYVPGTRVFPMATCRAQPSIGGSRWPVNLRRESILFTSVENNVDLADLSAFNSYNGKLFLDNGNSALQGTVATTKRQPFLTIDGETGEPFIESAIDRHKTGRVFTLRASGRQAVWEMRRMIHAIKGKWISFYTPTDAPDLNVAQDLLSATNTMRVSNVGYAQFVRNRQPKSDIRISFVDGSTPLLRAITGSSSPVATEDELVVDTNWPSTITPAEISRVDYIEKVRLDTDVVEIRYDLSGHRARMVAPIVGVFE